MTNYNENAEQKLLEMVKEREQKDKKLLHIEIFVGILVSIILLACTFVASFVQMDAFWRIALMTTGLIPFVIGICFAIWIEQVAGFYECQHCHHKYVPSYRAVLFSVHIGRSRKMKCPNCGEKNYHKKVIR